jgi:hypothetical protein
MGELNANEPGVTCMAGAMPVPVRVTICGLVGSEFVIVSVPVIMPVVVGLNLTLIRQLRPGATAWP